jgi:hypothetical protein
MKKYIAALCFCLALLIVQGAANPAPISIGHGLIGNMNPHETGAIVLGSYFDPNQGTYNNYWSFESRIFDYWRYMPSRFWYINKNNNWYKY